MTYSENGARSGALALVIAMFALAFGPLAGGARAADRSEAQTPVSWIEEMDAYFDANPALKTTPGSGYKQYSRFKWFRQQRMLNGQPPAPGAPPRGRLAWTSARART